MSLEHAILGFLNYQPFSGYDLKKIFDTSVRHFWPADQSQIYRTLTRLTERGWVAMEVVEQSERPDRKVYSITPKGCEELQRWLGGPPPVEDARSAPLVQVFFSGQLPDKEILARFEGMKANMQEYLGVLYQVPEEIDEYMNMVASPREQFFWLLTLELGIKVHQMHVEWADSVIRRLKEHDYTVEIPNPKRLA